MFVSIGDVRLFVDVDGAKLVPEGDSMRERPTIVMLHGGPGMDHTPFKAGFASLAEIAQVVYYDHRGNGRSESGPAELWTLDQWADDLRTLCDTLGIERPIVFGASFGGFVALNYAIRHPDHPAKLIVSSSTGRLHLDRAAAMFEWLGGPEVRAVVDRFFSDPTPENLEEYLEVCWPYYTQKPRPPEILARITRHPEVSEHFFRGELLTFENAEELAAALPRTASSSCAFPGRDTCSSPRNPKRSWSRSATLCSRRRLSRRRRRDRGSRRVGRWRSRRAGAGPRRRPRSPS